MLFNQQEILLLLLPSLTQGRANELQAVCYIRENVLNDESEPNFVMFNTIYISHDVTNSQRIGWISELFEVQHVMFLSWATRC